MNYPQYRRLVNGKVYYKIIEANVMEEIGTMGEKWWRNRLEAKILPERLMISDMVDGTNTGVEAIDEAEYLAFERNCENDKQQIAI